MRVNFGQLISVFNEVMPQSEGFGVDFIVSFDLNCIYIAASIERPFVKLSTERVISAEEIYRAVDYDSLLNDLAVEIRDDLLEQ